MPGSAELDKMLKVSRPIRVMLVTTEVNVTHSTRGKPYLVLKPRQLPRARRRN